MYTFKRVVLGQKSERNINSNKRGKTHALFLDAFLNCKNLVYIA